MIKTTNHLILFFVILLIVLKKNDYQKFPLLFVFLNKLRKNLNIAHRNITYISFIFILLISRPKSDLQNTQQRNDVMRLIFFFCINADDSKYAFQTRHSFLQISKWKGKCAMLFKIKTNGNIFGWRVMLHSFVHKTNCLNVKAWFK